MNSNQPPKSETSNFKSERLDFLKWSMNWVNNNALVEDTVFDIFELGTILQTLGFRVTQFDRNDELRNENEGNAMGSVKIEISCTKSGLRTVLSKSDSVCKCPHFKEKSEELEYVKTEGDNNLLTPVFPVLSTQKSQAVNGLIERLVYLVATDTSDSFEKMVKCCKLRDENYPIKHAEQELKMKHSISYLLDSSERDNDLSRHLLYIKEYAEKARALLVFKETSTPQALLKVKRVSNIAPLTPCRSTSGASLPRLPLRGTPRRIPAISNIRSPATPTNPRPPSPRPLQSTTFTRTPTSGNILTPRTPLSSKTIVGSRLASPKKYLNEVTEVKRALPVRTRIKDPSPPTSRPLQSTNFTRTPTPGNILTPRTPLSSKTIVGSRLASPKKYLNEVTEVKRALPVRTRIKDPKKYEGKQVLAQKSGNVMKKKIPTKQVTKPALGNGVRQNTVTKLRMEAYKKKTTRISPTKPRMNFR